MAVVITLVLVFDTQLKSALITIEQFILKILEVRHVCELVLQLNALELSNLAFEFVIGMRCDCRQVTGFPNDYEVERNGNQWKGHAEIK